MSGLEKIDSRPLPDFFVYCTYDKTGALTTVGAKDNGTAKIIYKDDRRYLFLGAGRNRDGYTRALFQKKIYETDTAYVTGDTMIFKHTSGHQYISVQIFTKIMTRHPQMKELQISFDTRKAADSSAFADFYRYKEWFNMDSAAGNIIFATIDPAGDPILKWSYLKQDQYNNNIDCTRSQYYDHAPTGMPVSLFWLKVRGFLH